MEANYARDLDKIKSTLGYVFMFARGAMSWRSLSQSPTFHAKTKHIEVHFMRDMLEDKNLHLVKVHIDDNPTDLLTKGLPLKRFAHYRSLMGVK